MIEKSFAECVAPISWHNKSMRKTAKLFVYSLGFLLLCMIPVIIHQGAVTASPWQSSSTSILNPETVLNDLARANVVYLGETHENQADHAAQLQIIQELHQQNDRIAIAMEMFQRPYQPVLDQYLAGEITEDELRQQSEYDRRWGFPWEYYAPILQFAQINQIPVLALNTPTEVTQKVAQKGLENLTEADRQWIPPLVEIHIDNEAYRQMIREVYDQFHQGHGSSEGFENFFLAQVLWDETMAETIANFLQANPDYQVVVLVGQGHVVYDYGIPSRVDRRLTEVPNFAQRSVLLNPVNEARSEDEIADYFWISPATE
ncbi:MAG: ChaN family lipoprotein [Cyanobacteria bacterium CRU_2_1]|nr:ChaN family lipoprotein [Cyanobacteria bacterium RU_5_0]NJR61662.1 ChaN family lipoprotein [Cyanobacteria bacterium CRU_2_1]